MLELYAVSRFWMGNQPSVSWLAAVLACYISQLSSVLASAHVVQVDQVAPVALEKAPVHMPLQIRQLVVVVDYGPVMETAAC